MQLDGWNSGFAFCFHTQSSIFVKRKMKLFSERGVKGGGWLQETTRIDVDVPQQDDRGR